MGHLRRALRYTALRYGVPIGAGLTALWIADILVQALRRAIGPSAHGLVVFLYVALVLTLLLLTLAGLLAARATGRLGPSAGAAAIAAALPTALLALVLSARSSSPGHRGPPDSAQIVGAVIAILLFILGGAVLGAIVSVPGALIGRARYHRRHGAASTGHAADSAGPELRMPANLPHAEPYPSAPDKETRQRRAPRLSDVYEWLLVFAFVGAALLMVISPLVAAEWASKAFALGPALGLALGALAAGIGLLRAGERYGWLGYLVDWLALVSLTFGIVLAVAEVSGYIIGLVSVVAPAVYMWRVGERYLRPALPAEQEVPEQAPVFFRHDGQTITVYPSRRKLAAHAAFAGGVAVAASGLAVVFRSADLIVVLALGAFGIMGLIGLAPDLVRLVHRWPALVVDSDGIVDLASAHVLGFGLIPWHEIADLDLMAGALRGGVFPELVIVPYSYRRLLAHQQPLKRPFLRLSSLMRGQVLGISSLLLSVPLVELALQIQEYVKTHAPPGFMQPDEAGDGDVDDSYEVTGGTP